MAASAEAVRDRLRQGPGWVILGAFQDGLVGAVGLMRDRSVKAKVLVLAVMPQFEGRGIDKTLLSLAVNWLRSFKPTRIWLGASSDPGTRSHGFYRALGWRPVGKKDTHGDEILVLPSPGE